MLDLKRLEFTGIDTTVLLLSLLLFLYGAGYILCVFNLSLSYIMLNLLILSTVYLTILLVIGRPAQAMLFGFSTVFLLDYIDSCVYAARLTHLRLTDFSVITQAARVISRYEVIWTSAQWKQLSLIIALIICEVAICRLLHVSVEPHKMRLLGCSVLLVLLEILVIGSYSRLLPIPERFSAFDSNATVKSTGLIGSWYSQAVTRRTEKPRGYDAAIAQAALSRYPEITTNTPIEATNIIVIMNESFTDYNLIGDLQFEDPLPLIHSMVKSGELFEGKLAVSVLGGGTCNTEWEFLTGNSLAFIPDGVYAFMSYINKDTFSIARDLRPLGYETSFFHPYYSQEWNREAVYRFFGFDSFQAGDTLEGGFVNKDDFNDATQNVLKNEESQNFIFGKDLTYIRTLISDAQAYRLLTDMVTMDDSVANDFMFCVTIQNHGGYAYEGKDFKSIEYVSGDDNYKYALESYNGDYSSRPREVNQYLTLSNISDQAFKEFIDSLSAYEERTVVIMFGDHQPGISVNDYVKYHEDIRQTVSEEKYIVPYLIWSNFVLDYSFPEYISANYLSAIIKDCAGLPLTSWDQFRLDTMQVYPVMTSHYVIDSQGNLIDDMSKSSLLSNYSYIQYMRMFD